MTALSRKRRALLCLALGFIPALGNAAPKSDRPADYAYSIPVQMNGQQGIVALRLPEAVYLNARSANLDDLRVFDANGAAKPFSLDGPPAIDAAPQRKQRCLGAGVGCTLLV